MRHFLFALLLPLSALAASRPAVSTYAPAQMVVGSGERYMTIEGSHFISGTTGPTVSFIGPDGPIEMTPNALSGYELSARLQVWIPQELANQIGRYRVTVSNAVNGESDPFYLDVTGAPTVVIYVPPYVSIEATSPSGAVVTYEASAGSTSGSEIVQFGCTPASGATLPLGQHSVSCTATASDGASRTVQFPVSVFDRTPPVLTVPQDILVDAQDRDGAVVEYQATAVDTVDTDVLVTCSYPSRTSFPIRTTEVRCSAIDDSFNSTVRSFTVTVTDNAFPMLMLPETIVVQATSWSGAIVHYTATAMDYAERTIVAECHPASDTLFGIGDQPVHCTATDDRERLSHGAFRVIVNAPQGQGPPTLVLPQDFAVEATSSGGAIVTFTATAVDYANRELPVTCNPASGTLFPIAHHNVACTATDDRGQSTSGTFLVIVSEPVDREQPMLELPSDFSVEATGSDGAIVTYIATAHDAEEGALPVTCTPPSGATFPLGKTVVTCSATNSRNATASGTFEVNVVDRTAPAILSITATPNRLWPVNRRMVNVNVSVTAVDDAGATLAARIVSVAVSESVSDTDWRIVSDLTVALRAARNGQEQPRVYTIAVAVSDSSGNISTGTVDVIVPHDAADNGTTTQTPGRRRSARH